MTAPSTRITVEEFFDPPTRSRALLSPDGTTIAYLAPWRGRLNVFVRDVDSDWATSAEVPGADVPGARRVTSDTRRSIDAFSWTVDGRYLLFQQDTDGDENRHLHRVDPSRPDEPAVDLTPDDGVRLIGMQLPPDRPGSAFVGLRRHSDRIAEALRARGTEVEYLLNEAEGHVFVNPDSNIELYQTLERFLARHLGGRASPIP